MLPVLDCLVYTRLPPTRQSNGSMLFVHCPVPSPSYAGFGDVGGTLVAQPAASPGGARLGEAGEASQDYMAAVQAMDEDPAAALLDVAGLPTPGGRLLAQQRAPKVGLVAGMCGMRGCGLSASMRLSCQVLGQSLADIASTPVVLQTEAQRWVEKLHTLYSSGAVVPLPFLRAVDAAPLALLGADRGPPGVPAAGAQGQVGSLGGVGLCWVLGGCAALQGGCFPALQSTSPCWHMSQNPWPAPLFGTPAGAELARGAGTGGRRVGGRRGGAERHCTRRPAA